MRNTGKIVAALTLWGMVGMGCVVIAHQNPVVEYRPIAGTQIRVVDAPGVAGEVFFYSGRYYRFNAGQWYCSPSRTGRWILTASVPNVFLQIPTSHPSYHVVGHHPNYHRPNAVNVGPKPPVRPHPIVARPPQGNPDPSHPPVHVPPRVNVPTPPVRTDVSRVRPEVRTERVEQKPHAPAPRVTPDAKRVKKASPKKGAKVSRADRD
jgi:hypothetical protein